MNIDDLTFGQIKQLTSLLGNQPSDNSHWKVGENYAIRTVTHIDVGKLVKVTEKELVLTDAAWVADTGRFQQFIADGEVSEVEPFPSGMSVIVGRGAIIDAAEWTHALLRNQK